MINAGCTLVLWFGVGLGVAATASAAEQYRPVVLMHGLDASASSMSRVKEWVEADYPGIHVKNVEVGNGKLDSWFMPIDKQVGPGRGHWRGLCDHLQGQFVRALVLVRGYSIIVLLGCGTGVPVCHQLDYVYSTAVCQCICDQRD
jgi:hypothetical protein